MSKKIAQQNWNKTETKVIHCNKTISSAVEMTQIIVPILFYFYFSYEDS